MCFKTGCSKPWPLPRDWSISRVLPALLLHGPHVNANIYFLFDSEPGNYQKSSSAATLNANGKNRDRREGTKRRAKEGLAQGCAGLGRSGGVGHVGTALEAGFVPSAPSSCGFRNSTRVCENTWYSSYAHPCKFILSYFYSYFNIGKTTPLD